jgi:hypothetical protein
MENLHNSQNRKIKLNEFNFKKISIESPQSEFLSLGGLFK